ncbi:MAG: hypothetical protein WC728_17980 [Elusimicrobiota bacterium]
MAAKAQARVGPLEKEKRRVEDKLIALGNDIQNLLNLVKAGGASQEAAAEVGRLEASKKELEARKFELEAQISHGRRAVYDVDVVAGALQRFARFIYRTPIELQIQTLRLMIRQVTVWKDRIAVDLNELAVGDLQLSLEGKLPDGDSFTCEPRRPLRRRGQSPTKKPLPSRLCAGTGFTESGEEWRARRHGKRTTKFAQQIGYIASFQVHDLQPHRLGRSDSPDQHGPGRAAQDHGDGGWWALGGVAGVAYSIDGTARLSQGSSRWDSVRVIFPSLSIIRTILQ